MPLPLLKSSRPDFNNGHQVFRRQCFHYGAGSGVASLVPVLQESCCHVQGNGFDVIASPFNWYFLDL